MTIHSPKTAIARFARALAEGAKPDDAWTAAGMPADVDTARERAAAPDVARLVAELRHAAGSGAEPPAMIARCLALANESARLGSAAGMMAAHRFIAEVGRFTHAALLAGEAHDDAESAALPPLMSDDEWLTRYAPAP